MINILGFNIIDCSMIDFMNRLIKKYLQGEKTVIVSGNPEILNKALKIDYIKNLCRDSIIIPDGVGVLFSARILGMRFKEKIAGIDIMENLLKLSNEYNMKIYLVGAEKWVVEKATRTCLEKYNSKIVGFHDGFFNIDDCKYLIDDINNNKADILFIGMGSPLQELFISKYRESLNCRVFMGVGGSFDILAGKSKRAPKWMIDLGLEWLYRVYKEPFRLRRLISIPQFLIKVLIGNKTYN